MRGRRPPARARTGAVRGRGVRGIPGGAGARRYSGPVTPEPSPGGPEGASDGPDPGGPGHHEDELERERDPAPGAGGPGAGGGHAEEAPGPDHRSWVLVVLACLLAVTSVVVVYARNQLLNTDTFVSTLAPLASDPAVQTAVATRVSDNLVARTNLEQQVQDALPARAGFLATPITSTVRSATYRHHLEAGAELQFQNLWEQALRTSHQQLDNLLTGSDQGPCLGGQRPGHGRPLAGGDPAKKQLAARGLTVFNKVPQYSGAPYVLFESKQLLKIQRLVKLLDRLALVLPILALLLFALSVVLARDRRKGLVHAAAGLAVSMALLLVVANVGRNQYLASLLPGQSKSATAAVIDTVSAVLLDSVRTILIVSAVVAAVAFAVGIGPVRRWLADRRLPTWLTGGPVHTVVAAHRRAFQWGVLVLGLVLLVLWNQPTVKVAVIVVLATFLVVLLVGLYGRRHPGDGSPSSDGGPPADRVAADGAAGAAGR